METSDTLYYIYSINVLYQGSIGYLWHGYISSIGYKLIIIKNIAPLDLKLQGKVLNKGIYRLLHIESYKMVQK